jgi:magnesium-transporting ATPase (P-type)
MTAPLFASAEERPQARARRAGFSLRVFAVFMALHGLVHVIGFTVPWGLGGPRDVGYSTLILNRSIEVGDTAVKLLGFVWLAAAIAFVIVAVMIWRGHPWALRSTVTLLIGSLVLCTIGLPGAVMGLAIDVALLVLLAFASEKLFGRPASRAVR